MSPPQVSSCVRAALGSDEFVAWARSDASAPYRLDGVFPPTVADGLREQLRGSSPWTRAWYVANNEDRDHVRVTRERFLAASPKVVSEGDIRYSSAEVLESQNFAPGGVLQDLLATVSGGEVAGLLSDASGVDLEAESYVNATRMIAGDFLRAHVDHEDSRIFGLLFYFADQQWTSGDGGELGYRRGDGPAAAHIAPTNNSMTVMYLGTSGVHWVRPMRSSTFHRYAVISHFAKTS